MKKLKNFIKELDSEKIFKYLDKIQFVKRITLISLIVWFILMLISIRESSYWDLFNKWITIWLISSCFLSFWLFVLLKNCNKNSAITSFFILIVFTLFLSIKFDDLILESNIFNIIFDKIFIVWSWLFCDVTKKLFAIFLPVLLFLFIYYETPNNNKKIVNNIWFVSIISYLLMYCLMRTQLWNINEFQNINYNLHSLTIYPQSIIANVIFFVFLNCLFHKIISFIFWKVFSHNTNGKSIKSNPLNKKFIISVLILCLIVEWFLVYNSSIMNYYVQYYSTEQEISSKPEKKLISNRNVYYSDDYWDEKSFDKYLWPINYWWCILLWSSWKINEIEHSAYMCKQRKCLKKLLWIWDKQCKTVYIDTNQ